MRAVAFDTLGFAKKLRSANFSQEQAEAMSEAVAAVVEEQVATKQDLKDLEVSIDRRFEEIKRDFKDMEFRLIISLGSTIVIVVGLAATILKFFIK